MAQWGKNDVASNSVLWAPSSVNLAPTRTNANLMFGNTTADSFESGETIGMFLADDAETTAARAAGPRPAHAGWVLRTEGSGGRAGRVSYETLVAMTSLSGDAEDVVLPDLTILISTQPADTSANTTDSEEADFTVVATTSPPGGTITYAWTYANGDAIQAGANVGVTTEATLTIDSSVETSTVEYKVTLSATGAQSVTSSNATLTITT